MSMQWEKTRRSVGQLFDLEFTTSRSWEDSKWWEDSQQKHKQNQALRIIYNFMPNHYELYGLEDM